MKKDTIIDKYWKCYYKIKNVPNALKNRYINKMHVIETSLNPWGYHDTNEILLYGMMDCFKKFYETEVVDGIVAWDYDCSHKTAKAEMDEIYTWWKYYPNRLKEIDDMLTKWFESTGPREFKPIPNSDLLEVINTPESAISQKYWDELNKLEATLETETEKYMTMLCKLRNYLWT